MLTQLIILSDLHTKKENEEVILNKILALSQIGAAEKTNVEKIILVLPGDISFSGQVSQFEHFKTCFELLVEELKKINPTIGIELITAPGNHDVLFTEENKYCDSLVANNDLSSINQLLSRQENYFSSFSQNNTKTDDKIAWAQRIETSQDFQINFYILNSALCIKRDSAKGAMTFPVDLLNFPPESDGRALNIAIMHHPLPWFTEGIRKQLKEKLLERCEILITGHEHQRDSYEQKRPSATCTHFEAPAFDDSKQDKENGVLSLYLSLNESENSFNFSEYSYVWNGEKFISENDEYRRVITSHTSRDESQFSESHEKWLNELTDKFIHPNKEHIVLDDIFVHPNLKNQDEEKKKYSIERGNDFIKKCETGRFSFISGETKSGKTLFAKKCILDLFSKGKKPIYINLREEELYKFDTLLKKSFKSQYSKTPYDSYLSNPFEERILIIDDFDITSKPTKKIEFLLEKKKDFSSILVFGETDPYWDSLSNPKLNHAFKKEFECFKILEFNKRQRSELVTKWELLNPDYDPNENKTNYTILEEENEIERHLIHSLIKKYPLFICMFLQARGYAVSSYETRQIETHGGLYEIVIKQQIVAARTKYADFVTINTYLEEFCFWLYSKKLKEILMEDYETFAKAYNEKYGTTRSSNKMLDDIKSSGILKVIYTPGGSEKVVFTQKYYYYYFIAKYLGNNISRSETKKTISEISKKIHQTEECCIWQFLTHISSDPFIIETISAYAKSLLPDVPEIKFNTDIDFVEGLRNSEMRFKLNDKDFAKSKKERIAFESELEKDAIVNGKQEDEEENEEDISSPVIQLITAYRTIDILGQLLRNFTGKLLRNDKEILLQETCKLAFRSLEFVLGRMRGHAQEFIAFLAKTETSSGSLNQNREEIFSKYSTIAYNFLQWVTFAMLHKVAISVSHPQLVPTYTTIEGALGNTYAIQLLHRMIELNTNKLLPSYVKTVCESDLRTKRFCFDIARNEAIWHCYYYPVDRTIKVSTCKKLGIEYNALVLNDYKKTIKKDT